MEEAPTVAFLEEVSRTVLQKSMENVYACGGDHLFNMNSFGHDGLEAKVQWMAFNIF